MADGDGLENRCPRKGTVGSNPTPSAIIVELTERPENIPIPNQPG